jgi:hypothetical protein
MLPGTFVPGTNTIANLNAASINISNPAGMQDQVGQLEFIARNGNHKERTLAAVRMLNLDLDRSLGLIKEMMAHSDPFLRETMAAAMGEIYHPLTMELLLEGLKDNEKRVVNAAARSLKKIEKMPDEVVPPEVRVEIQKNLKKAEI